MSKKINEVLICPFCKNRNIKAIGIYYQCSSIDGDRVTKTCGYIGIIDKFKRTLLS